MPVLVRPPIRNSKIGLDVIVLALIAKTTCQQWTPLSLFRVARTVSPNFLDSTQLTGVLLGTELGDIPIEVSASLNLIIDDVVGTFWSMPSENGTVKRPQNGTLSFKP
jgi:hypothetical protein